MERKAHILKPNLSNERPQNMIFYDVETIDGEKHKENEILFIEQMPILIGASYYTAVSAEFRQFFGKGMVDEFWGWVFSKIRNKTKLYLIAHNQHFDFNVLKGLEYIFNAGFHVVKFVIDSDLFYLKFKKDSSSICVIDTFNYAKASLEEMGKSVGLTKLEVDFSKCDFKELMIYNKRDVEILQKWFLNYLKFLDDHKLGNFSISIAGQSFNAFVHRFMKNKIYIHNLNGILELERESYFGGRTEAFYIGSIEVPIYELDFISMYPSVMRNNPVPVKYKYFNYNDMPKLFPNEGIIAKVRLNTIENAYPCRRDKVIFPVGRFVTTLATPEYLYAYANGHIETVYYYALYDMDVIFKNYVEEFYKIKNEAKDKDEKINYDISKLFLNSLYGKFGQKIEEYELVEKDLFHEPKAFSMFLELKGETKKAFVFHKDLYVRTEPKEWYNSFPAISSHIASYARMKLYNAMKVAGLEHVYYCDTDSLFVDYEGYSNLLQKGFIGQELGDLEVKRLHERLIIYGAKDYESEKVVKVKGVPQKAVKRDDFYVYENFTKTKTMLMYRLPSACKYVVKKKLTREYDKGQVLSNGRVIPFYLEQEPQDHHRTLF